VSSVRQKEHLEGPGGPKGNEGDEVSRLEDDAGRGTRVRFLEGVVEQEGRLPVCSAQNQLEVVCCLTVLQSGRPKVSHWASCVFVQRFHSSLR
jgi:hypothetical protein